MSGLLTGDLSRIVGGTVDERTAARIRAEQLAPILRYSTPLAIANIFNVVVAIATLQGSGSTLVLGIWAAIIFACLGRVYTKRSRTRRPRPTAVSASGVRKATINGLVLGIAWGILPAIFFPSVSDQSRIVITCITAGMLGGGAFALASLPTAALAMILPLLAGSLWGILSMGGLTSMLMATLVVVYSGVLIHGVLIHGLNVAQRVASTLAMERIANSDSLTNLANRTAFREAMQLAESNFLLHGQSSTLFFVDLDFFKVVNDTHGHAVGDAILVEAGHRLRACTRRGDLVARLGGDELAILVPKIDSPELVLAYASRLVLAFREPFVVGDKAIAQTISVGVATCSRANPGGTRTMIHHADIALYRAKHKGRNTYHLYREGEEGEMTLSDSMERDLRAALLNNELSLVFQPIVRTDTLVVTGFEALLRWNHPVNGWIPPKQIVALADERGLSDALAAWVLSQACETAVAWPEHLRVAVNLSPAQMRSLNLPGHVSTALARSEIDPARLEIDLVEAAFSGSDGLVKETLLGLHERGVKLALDDFGASYAVLRFLRKVPFERVKIDGCFIREMTRQRDSAAIVRSVTGLARELGLMVVAEEVETEEGLAFLRDLECAEAQGFLFSEPLAPAAVPGFLLQRRLRLVA